jgi:lipopolysaccharide export system protein LptA
MSMPRTIVLSLLMMLAATAAQAQGAAVPFGGLQVDNSLPVEISADTLSIDQGTGKAAFTGNVEVGQGTLHMRADHMVVTYLAGQDGATGAIQLIEAEGDVTLTNGAESAEGEKATYAPATGEVVMIGKVLLTQGKNALSGETLRINLNAGTALVEGRVTTIFQPATKP